MLQFVENCNLLHSQLFCPYFTDNTVAAYPGNNKSMNLGLVYGNVISY